MKYIICLLLSYSFVANAQNLGWDQQKEDTVYKSTTVLTLYNDSGKFTLPAGTTFELYEVSDLNMIKVHLHKYRINNCVREEMETDLQLISTTKYNKRKTSVGVNLAPECKIEIFVDMGDYSTISFLEERK